MLAFVKWGNLTLKIYDKGGRVLRIEVVAHNVKDLRSGLLGPRQGAEVTVNDNAVEAVVDERHEVAEQLGE